MTAQQQMSGIDGQVAVRSDYAVYLIANGQRRWIATVQITDEEINAYPEAEPIFSGVTPLPPQIADARGRCSFKIRVPSTVPNGLGFMKGSVRSGGRTSNQTVEFQIVSDVQ